MVVFLFDDLCTSYLGSYGAALTRCDAGGSGALEASFFFPPTDRSLPPPCTGSPYARFPAPAAGVCVASEDVTTRAFAPSYRFSAPLPACSSSAAASAVHVTQLSACGDAPFAYYTLPTGPSCVPRGYFSSSATLASVTNGGASLDVAAFLGNDSCAGSPQYEFVGLPLTGVCTPGSGGSAAALPATSFTNTPTPSPLPPPRLPGTAATLLLWGNASDCAGPL